MLMAVKKSVAAERRAMVGLYRRLFALPMHSAGLARRPYSAAAIMTVLIIGSIITFRGAVAMTEAATRKRLPEAELKAGSGSDLKASMAMRRAETRLIERVIKPAIAAGPEPKAGTIQLVVFRLFQSLRLAFEPLMDQLGADQRFL